MNIPILIPAYNPDKTLIEVTGVLFRAGFSDIVIVDDGSKPECATIFHKLDQTDHCHVLRHAVNCGKGRALKTGLNYIYLNFPEAAGVVTADADGQHRPEDIVRVAKSLAKNPGSMVMGVRKMGKEVPLRSLLGNVLTRAVFALVMGKKISDTQSGLRGLPRAILPDVLKIKGERYEFEINMLILTKMKSVTVLEVPIDTIYIEDNKSSHFNPFFDSMKIYFQLLRYAFSSMLTSILDFIVFTIMFALSGDIMVSILVARFVVGSIFNFIVNRWLVFHSRAGVMSSLFKYYTAILIMSIISYQLIDLAMFHMGFSVVMAKVVVETLLFGVTFLIQRDFVFGKYGDDS